MHVCMYAYVCIRMHVCMCVCVCVCVMQQTPCLAQALRSDHALVLEALGPVLRSRIHGFLLDWPLQLLDA